MAARMTAADVRFEKTKGELAEATKAVADEIDGIRNGVGASMK